MNKQYISKSVIRRLPRYYRFLNELEEQNVERVSSNKLAEIMRVTASQVRQDLNCFGGFGHQGYGYPVSTLKEEIKNILGLNNNYKAVLLGAGNLGNAIATHMKFEKLGFKLVGVFDSNERLSGTYVGDIIVQSDHSLENFCKENKVDAAFLCIPRSAAPDAVRRLYNSGVKSFWNFTHYHIQGDYPDAIVENVHLSDIMMTLCFSMNEQEGKNE
jgi:redox-sensing transcriptional repressor